MGWETVRTEPDPRTDAELEALRDDDVVRRAELWATAATIHNVKGLIGLYRSGTGSLDHPHAWTVRRYALEVMVCGLESLEALMRHGDYRKARIETPLPWWNPEWDRK